MTPIFRSADRDHTVGVFCQPGDKLYYIAQYLKEDLMLLLEKTPPLNLFTWFNLLPGEYPENPQLIIELICDDIALLIREEMIAMIHLVFSEIEPVDDQFPMTFHAVYAVLPLDRVTKALIGTHVIGARMILPVEAIEGKRFTILIDWIPGLTRARASLARRHRQFFDWVPFDEEQDRVNAWLATMGSPRR